MRKTAISVLFICLMLSSCATGHDRWKRIDDEMILIEKVRIYGKHHTIVEKEKTDVDSKINIKVIDVNLPKIGM